MEETTKTSLEGGTDLKGLEDFIIDVSVELEDETPPHVTEDGEKIEVKTEVEKEEDKTPEEEVQTPPTEETEVEPQPKHNQADSYYSKLAEKFLEKGKWQDAEIEMEDGKVVKLSELDTIDEETFFAIEDQQSKFNEEEIKTNYISKRGLDESRLKLIEIVKEGGDLTQIFKTPQEMQRPFEGVNLEDDTVQSTVFYNYLTKVEKHNAEVSKQILEAYAKRGELEGKVKEIVGKYQSEYDKKLETQLEAIKQEKAVKKQKDKEFTKSLEEIYSQYELDQNLAKKFASLGTKRNQQGDFELDTIYGEKLEDPKEAAELIFFLTDKEGYLKSKMSSAKIENQKEQLRRINILKGKNKKEGDSEQQPSDDGLDEFRFKIGN